MVVDAHYQRRRIVVRIQFFFFNSTNESFIESVKNFLFLFFTVQNNSRIDEINFHRCVIGKEYYYLQGETIEERRKKKIIIVESSHSFIIDSAKKKKYINSETRYGDNCWG